MNARCPYRLPAAAVTSVLALSGCVSPKFQFAPKDTPPPVVLNLAATQSPIDVVVRHVIMPRGPGSWKLEALWDEYLISVANRGTEPLVLASARLSDHANRPIACGVDPWELEKKSFKQMLELHRTAGPKPPLVATAAVVAVGVAAAAMPLVALPTAAGLAIVNAGNDAVAGQPTKQGIEQEFARRRLALPVTLEPGCTVEGSLFFAITPEPLRLVIQAQVGGRPVEAAVDLAPLSGLHQQIIAASTMPAAAPAAGAKQSEL